MTPKFIDPKTLSNVQYGAYLSCQKANSSWSYNSCWGDQMEDAILHWFAKSIPDKSSSILDLGCGEGRGMLALRKAGFTNVCGCDISMEKISKARQHGFEAYEVDMHYMSRLRNRFEYVFASHVFEHSLSIPIVIDGLTKITSKRIFYIVPIGYNNEVAHTNYLETCNDFTKILDDLKLTHLSWPMKRLSNELWGIIKLNQFLAGQPGYDNYWSGPKYGMEIHKSYKTKIYPTKKQERMLAQHFGCARFVYNYFLQYKTDQYKKTKKSATWCQMSKELPR